MITKEQIIEIICSEYNVTFTALCGDSRLRCITIARHVLMLILSRELGLTQAEISKLLCRKSVSTISAAIKRITGLIETDRAINQRYQGVLARISNY